VGQAFERLLGGAVPQQPVCAERVSQRLGEVREIARCAQGAGGIVGDDVDALAAVLLGGLERLLIGRLEV
jgi:hypothetical protein